MNRSIGIRTQLMAGIVLTTLAGIGLIGLLSIKIVENNAVYWRIGEAEKVARIIRIAVDRDGRGDEAVGLRLAQGALKEIGVRDFRFTDGAGRILASNGAMPANNGEPMPSPGLIRVSRAGGGWFKGPGDMLFISAPLGDEGRGKGLVEFAVPLAEIREDTAVARRFLLLYAFLDSAIIIAFGVFFLSRSIITPINKLEEAAERIAGGKLGERADVAVDNEVGSLASSFNTMADRLESEIKSLERVNNELVSTQEELLRSSTLAAVGSLAAGIAHEIGNPLGAVRGYLDILSSGAADKDEEKEILERASREISRIDFIVREFLEISRPSKKKADHVDVNALIEETVSTLTVHKDLSGIKMDMLLKKDLPRVLIDERKLRQVFVNLLINAAHSMENKEGLMIITIETVVEKRAVERGRRKRRKDDPVMGKFSEATPAHEYVVISFTDTGRGISEEDAGKVFDPFFTTKDVGKGTGLGLFVSQGIIKAYGGEIKLKTEAGVGSTFSVALPSGETNENTDN
jgi:two-component system, NtrC family, sensor kinase